MMHLNIEVVNVSDEKDVILEAPHMFSKLVFGDDVTNVKVIPFMTPTMCMQIIHVQKKPNKMANTKRRRLFIG
jgi:hypothetical protein